jgi:transcriptional regulator with XRE-family HTH domain
MTLGRMIRRARKAAGMTQEQLADELQTSAHVVAGWERDRHLPVDRHLQGLARVLELDLDELRARARPTLLVRRLAVKMRHLFDEEGWSVVDWSDEDDPFRWRLAQVLEWRRLSPALLARTLGKQESTVRRWLAGGPVPRWPTLFALADLLDVPVWWWRLGYLDGMAVFGGEDPGGGDTTVGEDGQVSEEFAWSWCEDRAAALGVEPDEIARIAYPSWTGWRWEGRLHEWTPPPAPRCPFAQHLHDAIYGPREARFGLPASTPEEHLAMLQVACEVDERTLARWLSGERVPRWQEAKRAADAVGLSAWQLWRVPEAMPALS